MISLDPLFSFSLLESLQMESNAQILSALMAGGAWKSSANALANVQVHTGLGFIRVPAVPLYMYIMYCHVLCCGGMFRVIQSVIVMAICYCIVVGVGFVLVFSLVFLFCAMYPSILLGGLRIQKRQGVKKQKNKKNMVTHKKWCLATKRRGGVAEGPRGGRSKNWFDQQNEDILDQQKEDMRPKDLWTWVLI